MSTKSVWKMSIVVLTIAALLLPTVVLGSLEGPELAPTANQESIDATDGPIEVVEGSTTEALAAEVVELAFLEQLPELSPERQEQMERAMAEFNVMEAPYPESAEPVAGPSGGETRGRDDALAETIEEAPPLAVDAPGTFTIFRSTSLTPSGGSIGTSDINEPALANSGKYVFFTGNWYAARSTNGGSGWSYVDPFADMSDFCCDQDVIYAKSRDIFIWYRQGSRNASGVNKIRIGVSTNGGSSYCFWNWTPTQFNSGWTNQWWDYPHLALSNDFLYFTSNMFNNASTPSMTRSVLARASLDTLRACGSLSWTYWTQTSGRTWTPVQGATETMYVGRTTSTSSFTVWKQPESTTTLTSYTRSVPSWTSGAQSCSLPNGNNPCARSDNRVKAGWVAKGVVGFFWNVAAGSGFPMPYVNAATFTESNLNYQARPYIWCCSSGTSPAWHYAAAYPNERGDLGIAVWKMGGGNYPKFYVGIDDDYNGAPPGWEVMSVSTSTTGPGANVWGDYLRVRPHEPAGLGWIASAFRSISGGVSQPRFAIFGRDRDRRSIERWWNEP